MAIIKEELYRNHMKLTEFTVPDDVEAIEEEAFRSLVVAAAWFAVSAFDSDVVDAGSYFVVAGRCEIHRIDECVFVGRRDDIPCVVGIFAGAGALDCAQDVFQAILPYLSTHIFAFLFEGIDEKRHLLEVKRIVVQRQLGIFDDGVALLLGVLWKVGKRVGDR